MTEIRPRERDQIIQALRAGVVPKQGLAHIQVGRKREIEEVLKDVERISDGGSSIRFIIGEYGSGKTFFMNLVRLIALEKGLVTMFADLAPDRRLHATGGQARGLFAEMARNTATRSKPEGGALTSVVERFIGQVRQDANNRNIPVGNAIHERLAHLQELTNGFEFAEVVRLYWEGFEKGNEDLQTSAIKWLRGEYATRTDARNALGVRTIIDDGNVYDMLKLMAVFCKEAGYDGLLVGLDEMVNLFKLTSSQARSSNYEQILRILNDVFQGSARHLGFLMGGTPEFLMNTRRGLYSYEALQSRLVENSFVREGMVDLSGPVVRLANLTPEDLYVLLVNIRKIVQGNQPKLPDEAITNFMKHCSERIGEAYFRTPRNTVTAFVNLLAVLEQNAEVTWQELLAKTEISHDPGVDLSDIEEDAEANVSKPGDDLASFRL